MTMQGEHDSDEGDSSVAEDNDEGMGDIDLEESAAGFEEGEERKEPKKASKKRAAKDSDEDDEDA